MGQAYDIPQAPHGLPQSPVDPATGKPIQEFVDGVPVSPTTGRPMVRPGAPDKPVWIEQLVQGQPGISPALVSPVPVTGTPAMAQAVQQGPATSTHAQAVSRKAALEVSGPPMAPLPAMPVAPAPPAEASGKCITEGCKSKTKDRGMCARCLKDTMEYMKKDPKITWEFLEANGLALPSSSTRSGNKFLAGLTAKLAKLHSALDGSRQP